MAHPGPSSALRAKSPGYASRYQEVSRCLQEAKLPFTVEFAYQEQGLRIQGRWFPILKMQWVEGFTLNDFIRRNLDKPAMLEGLLQIWLRMAQRLRAAGIAHADLQHGNVLLVPGSTANAVALKLIDYDGMFVPTLAGRRSGEVGHPAYQHPQRQEQAAYNAEVDRFPLLLVASVLRGVQVGGRALWEKYDNSDNLLFREKDLKEPDGSLLFRDLFGLAGARALVGMVRRSLGGPLLKVPLLEEALGEPRLPTPLAARPTPPVQRTLGMPSEMVRSVPANGTPALLVLPGAVPATRGNLFAFDEMPTEQPAVGRTRRRKAKTDPVFWWGGLGAAAVLLIAGIVVAFLIGRESGAKNKRPAERQPDQFESRSDTNAFSRTNPVRENERTTRP